MTRFRFSPLPLPRTSTIGGGGFAMQPSKFLSVVGTASRALTPEERRAQARAAIDEPLAQLGRSTGGSRGSLIRFLTNERTRELLRERVDRVRESLRADAVDITQLQIQNDAFVPVNNVINSERPELIATVAFNPIWAPGTLSFNGLNLKNLSPAGLLINFQYQTKQLRQETLQALITDMLNAFGDTTFDKLKSDFESEINKVETDLQFLNSVLQKVDIINSSLDVKDIPDSYYDNISRTRYRGGRGGEVLNAVNAKRYPNFRRFATDQMQFNNSQYENFSETKLLLQLLFDLNAVLENYSFGLLDISDNDRAADVSSTTIDKTYSLTNGFSFNIANYRDARFIGDYSPEKIDNLIYELGSSLPGEPDSAIKLLVNTLAKEYLISAGLGNPSNRDILSKYSPPGGSIRTNIFDIILGNVGDNIFQLPQGLANSLARTLYIEDTNLPGGNLILPFENRYITNPLVPGIDTTREVSTYIPGTSYFTDAIIKTDTNQWNVRPYTDFVTRYSDIVNNVKTAIYKLLNLDALQSDWFLSTGTSTRTPTSLLSPVDLFRYFVYGLQNSFDRLRTAEQDALNNISQRQEELINLYNYIRSLSPEADLIPREGGAGAGASVREYASKLREYNASLDVVRPSSIQAFIMALFTEAASSPELKKVLFKICLLRGIYKNLLNRSDFFDRLTIYDIDNVNKITGIGNAITNSTNSGFNIGTLDNVIDRYIENDASIRLFLARGLRGGRLDRSTIASIDGNEINIATIDISDSNELMDLLKTIVKFGGAEGGRWRFNLIEQCNVVAAKLLSSTKQGEEILSLLSDDSITRFNGIDLITQYAFIFETFVQMAKKYSGVSFGGTVRSSTVASAEDISAVERGESRPLTDVTLINVRIDISKQEAFHISADEFKKVEPALSTNPPPNLHSALFVYNDLYSIYSKLKKEFDYVRYALGVFEVIGQRLQDTNATVSNFFNSNSLAEFLSGSSLTDINIIRYPSQVRLSNFIYNNIKEKYTYADSLVTLPGGVGRAQISNIREKMVVSDAILPSEFNALVSCFSFDHPDFKTTVPRTIDYYDDPVSRNSRIVTVGIPAGFSTKLADRVSRETFDRQGANSKQSDVIEIRIHPVDLRFADIVLKPITYLFDLSLFVSKKNMYDLDAQSGENFSRLLERLTVTELQSVNNIRLLNQTSLLNDSQYNFLSDEQKRNIFLNTFRSYLFEVYINCLNGMKLSEDVFLASESDGRKILNNESKNLLNQYLASIDQRVIPLEYTTTEDILSSPGYTQTVKDAYRLFTYGSLVFNQQELTRRVMTPKYFDRVFHLGVDLSRLEIDRLGTLALAARQGLTYSFAGARDAGVLEEEGSREFLKTTEPNDFIIKSIFMNIVRTDTGGRSASSPIVGGSSGGRRTSDFEADIRESRSPGLGIDVGAGRF